MLFILTGGPGDPARPCGPGDPASPFCPGSPGSPFTPGWPSGPYKKYWEETSGQRIPNLSSLTKSFCREFLDGKKYQENKSAQKTLYLLNSSVQENCNSSAQSLEDHRWDFLNSLWSQYFHLKYFLVYFTFFFSLDFLFLSAAITYLKAKQTEQILSFLVLFFLPREADAWLFVEGLKHYLGCGKVQGVNWKTHKPSIWSINSFQPLLLMVQIFSTFSRWHLF